ncbi:uncharacterized protein F4812DRAFT_461307 [Daldinia caldariorum]|uniref:uncharacterized protein n=1 Tax=Daldinia caldariorum TaxID=326644 RepID=UPI0020073834|nr:uncharacterized protein F4812DRAFT_461307 [Daldinia caldariorum]KAI1465615.1 hypothetical protein F4812DRAFT_461307 [Daldinia caldariorum]
MGRFACPGVLKLAMVLVTVPVAMARQAYPTRLPVPVTLGHATVITPTQTYPNTTNNNINDTSLPVQTDEPDSTLCAPPGPLRIIDEDPVFKYVGCWSELTLIDPAMHALDGPSLMAPGLMNVHLCVDFCRHTQNRNAPNRTGFQYAALEYSFQCWCGDHLSEHSSHLVDTVCDLPCDGANTTACGGHLAMTLYNATQKKTPGGGNDGFGNGTGNGTGGSVDADLPRGPDAQAALQTVGLGLLALAVTFALGWECL